MTDTPLDICGELADVTLWRQENAADNDQQLYRLRQKLRQAKNLELTPRQQQILALHYDQRMTIAQIAKQLGVHRSTVSRTLQRARKRLHHYLQYTL